MLTETDTARTGYPLPSCISTCIFSTKRDRLSTALSLVILPGFLFGGQSPCPGIPGILRSACLCFPLDHLGFLGITKRPPVFRQALSKKEGEGMYEGRVFSLEPYIIILNPFFEKKVPSFLNLVKILCQPDKEFFSVSLHCTL